MSKVEIRLRGLNSGPARILGPKGLIPHISVVTAALRQPIWCRVGPSPRQTGVEASASGSSVAEDYRGERSRVFT